MLPISALLLGVDRALGERTRIHDGLRRISSSLNDREDLRKSVERLNRGESTAEEQLAIYRAIRDAGLLPPEAGFFLVAHALTVLADSHVCASQDTDPAFQRLHRRASEIREQYGLDEDQDWPAGQGPPEYRALDDVWAWLVDDVRTRYMRGRDEPEMANLYRQDPAAFWRRYEDGRRFFFPDDGHGNEWLEAS